MYEKLLLGTSGSPRHLPFGGESIVYLRTLDDYRRLRALTETGDRFAVIGGGVIRFEVAAARAMNGKYVTMIFPGKAALAFSADLSKSVTQLYQEKGVEVLTGKTVEGVDEHGNRLVLHVSGNQSIAVDAVVAGIGITPNADLTKATNLNVSNGIVVDEILQTSALHIYAAGDVANVFNPALNKRIRVEHEDNANTMGRLAG